MDIKKKNIEIEKNKNKSVKKIVGYLIKKNS